MKNNNLFKFLLLLNGILSILAVCPSYPTIPTTSIPKTNPIVLTSASEGMISLDPSLSKLSITMTVTLDEVCPSDGDWDLFTLTVNPSGEHEKTMAEFYIECNTFDLYGYGTWFNEGNEGMLVDEIFTGSSRTVNIYVTIDLDSQEISAEAKSADAWDENSWTSGMVIAEPASRRLQSFGGGERGSGRVLEGELPHFDETTKLYLCSYKNGAESALACTVSRLELVSMFDDDLPTHLGDFTPVTQAFYPLTDGELSSLIKSADSAYFGDSASSPTAGSSPSWDSSNSFVQISSATQFLTLPIPSIAENSIFIPTMTFAFWIRITSIPQYYATLFSVILENGTPGFNIVVLQETLAITSMMMKDTLKITLDTWQLISCSFYFAPDSPMYLALSIGDSKTVAVAGNFRGLAPTKLQIGDSTSSFIGDISSVRILSSGAGYLTDGDTCSPNNAIQINSGPYAISCAEGSSFNPYDNKCYSSCPAKTGTVTPFEDAPFTLCIPGGSSVTVEESSSGLSGGAIAGIVIGSVAGVAMIGAVGYFAKLKIAKSVAAKKGAKAYEMKSPTSEDIPATTTNMVSP